MSKMINGYKLYENGVQRKSDGACIPECDGNRDWRAYQEWLASGNTPDPMDVPAPPTVDELRKRDILTDWPVEAQLEAITEHLLGRPEKKDALLFHIGIVKQRYPKDIN